jgi:LmbE family N-acetylglucosaminyl deacetylase
MFPILISAVFWQKVIATEPKIISKKIINSEFRVKNSQHVYKTENVAIELNKEFWKKYAKKKIFRGSRKTVSRPVQEQVVKNNQTILIIAPHPDDEILCCTNVISENIAAGGNVKIIYVTDGGAHSKDDSHISQQYAQRRRTESSLAARRLGLGLDDLFFLGFPDGSLDKLSNKPLQSDFTAQDSTSRNTFFPKTKYTYHNLKSALETIITEIGPNEIYLPSTADEHPDHQAVGALVKDILRKNDNLAITGLEYLVHSQTNECGKKTDLRKADTKKLSLIRIFTSQFHTKQHKNFLEQFAVIPENFEAILERFAKK